MPGIPMNSLWLDGVSLRNSDKLFKAIEPYENVRCLVWGHVHQEMDSYRNGVLLMSSPSSCIQFAPGSVDFKVDDQPPGYRWLGRYGQNLGCLHR